jgi:hypothetical protein
MSMPVMLLKSSLDRCAVEPLPDDAKLMAPGFAFASVTRSFTDAAATDG